MPSRHVTPSRHAVACRAKAEARRATAEVSLSGGGVRLRDAAHRLRRDSLRSTLRCERRTPVVIDRFCGGEGSAGMPSRSSHSPGSSASAMLRIDCGVTAFALRSAASEGWCQGADLNRRPKAYESSALPLSYPGSKTKNDGGMAGKVKGFCVFSPSLVRQDLCSSASICGSKQRPHGCLGLASN